MTTIFVFNHDESHADMSIVAPDGSVIRVDDVRARTSYSLTPDGDPAFEIRLRGLKDREVKGQIGAILRQLDD